MPKTVYQLDPSGVFTGEVACRQDPLDQDRWLVPAGCIEVAPPEIGEGQAARWTGSAWDVVPDHRGETWWTAEGAPVKIAAVGDPAQVSLQPDEPELPEPPPPAISDRQFFQGLANRGIITKAEALAAVRTGDIPAALQALVDGLAEGMQFDASMKISGATTFDISDPIVQPIAEGFDWTPEQTAAAWREFGAL